MNLFSRFLSIRSRLMLMLVLVSAISAMVLIWIGYQNGKKAISESIFNQLTSVKAAKKYQIESYFKEIANVTEILGENKAIHDALVDFATFIDFKTYRLSYGAPASFVGIPITEGSNTIGALVFQLPVGEINKIMTGSSNWEVDGLGESGETYLVGEDYKMRSISRFYLQDTVGYTNALTDLGVEKEQVEKMYRIGTTILEQKVKTEGVKSALEGKNETRIIDDYRFVPVLSSYAPLQIRGLNWAILSAIDEAEANIPIMNFQKRVFIALCVIILLVTFLAMFLAGKFVQPIDRLTEGVRRLSSGDFSKEIEVNSNDEFGELATSFNVMIHDIEKQQNLITKQNHESEKLLLNFIPESVARRLQKGETNIADTYPNVSLITIDVAGFSKLTTQLGAAKSINILNQLVEAYDAATHKYAVEKIRTVGDTYFASCGMFSPRLDHAKKVFDFALEIRQLTAQFNLNYKLDLALHIGIHSGEVMAGIVGTEHFSYDLWGETVNAAFQLKNIGDDNVIFISDTIYQKLKDSYEFEKVIPSNQNKLNVEVWKYMEQKRQIKE